MTVLAVYCTQITTGCVPFTFGESGGYFGTQYVLRGWPIIWSESVCEMSWDINNENEQSGPVEYRGSNQVIPVLMVTLAVCLPPAVAGFFARRSLVSRTRRSARVAVLAATVGLSTAAAEMETAAIFYPTPLTYIDRLINTCRSDVVVGTAPDGTPVYDEPVGLITGSEWYWEARSRAARVRGWIGRDSLDAQSDWRVRTQLTLAATALGLLIGCLLFRPWRRPPPDLAAGGTEHE
jgi:hypothetical protein